MPLVLIDYTLIPEPTTSLRGMRRSGWSDLSHVTTPGTGVGVNTQCTWTEWERGKGEFHRSQANLSCLEPRKWVPENHMTTTHITSRPQSTPPLRGVVWAGSLVYSASPSGDSVSWRLPLTSLPLKLPLVGAVVYLYDPTPVAPGHSYARKPPPIKRYTLGGGNPVHLSWSD